MIVNAIFTATIGFGTNIWALCILSALAGAGAGLVNPAQQAVLADVIGSERAGGKVLANFQMAQDFGAITGPILVGAIAGAIGFQYGFMVCGVIGLVAAVAWMFGRETLPTAKIETLER